MELNFSFKAADIGTFRINVFRQRGDMAVVARFIKARVGTAEDLHLPEILKDLIMEKRGLVLVVGATGSGKSTTLASMIEHRSNTTGGHILTIRRTHRIHIQARPIHREPARDRHRYPFIRKCLVQRYA